MQPVVFRYIMQAEQMRAAFLNTVSRRLATLLALPLVLAAAPLCEACPVNTDTAVRAPSTSHAADHACCEKKPQVKQAHKAEHCDNCVAKPATPNSASELKADLHFSPVTHRAMPEATPVVLPGSTNYITFFYSHSPPAVYLVQQKILV